MLRPSDCMMSRGMVFVLLFGVCFRALAGDPLNEEVGILLDRIMKANPRILAARARVEQALDRHEELLGFFDPSVYAAGGKTERARGLPGGYGWTSLSNDAHEMQAGMQVPLRPGAYLNVGGAERFLFNGGDYDHLYQTILGLRLRIPLLQDRGFSQWTLTRARALADYNEAVGAVLTIVQAVRHECERATVYAYETLAAYQVAHQATERYRTLLEEARGLSELKVIPHYQVYPAEMELSFRQEEEERARQAHELSLIALEKIVGDGQPVKLELGPEQLLRSSDALKALPEVVLEMALERRGNHVRILSRIAAARAELHLAEDENRAKLSINAGAMWQGEDPDSPLADRSLTTDKSFGGEVLLVYRRPLWFRAERSRLSQRLSHIAELKQNLEDDRIQTRAELETAKQAFERIVKRLELLGNAMEAARKTLKAESERFRLGEGRSRNVLDAQRDLTTALQRQTRAAADLLRATYDYYYAAGYPETR